MMGYCVYYMVSSFVLLGMLTRILISAAAHTADGGLLASHLDLDKLSKWWLIHTGCALGQIEQDDLICRFCIWDARFLYDNSEKDDFVCGSLNWWPEEIDPVPFDVILEKNYNDGNIKQCWVQLEKLDEDDLIEHEHAEKLLQKQPSSERVESRSECLVNKDSEEPTHTQQKQQQAEALSVSTNNNSVQQVLILPFYWILLADYVVIPLQGNC